LDTESFVKAIAPAEDLTKIGRRQFSILFRVADTSKRGLVSWEDFVVFETLLKRPDADYFVAFQYFDVYAVVSPALLPTVARCNWKFPTVTALERSRSTSLRTPSKLISNRMPSPSISTGASFAISLWHAADNFPSVHSDWVKLYLGTKNGTHVLGCMRALLARLFPLAKLRRI